MDYAPQREASHDIVDGKGCDVFKPTAGHTHAVAPTTGSALVFSHVHNCLHDGEPVTDGEAHATTWAKFGCAHAGRTITAGSASTARRRSLPPPS